MRKIIYPTLFLAITLIIVAALSFQARGGDPSSPRVALSNTGMEGLSEVKVQIHLSVDPEWRELVDLDNQKLEQKIKEQVRQIPGIKLIEGETSEHTPRLLVIVVGHLIADPEGNKDTCATNIIMALNQPVSLRRLPSDNQSFLTGMTWHRSVMITGVREKMRERVTDKLTYLVGQFSQEHTRANASS